MSSFGVKCQDSEQHVRIRGIISGLGQHFAFDMVFIWFYFVFINLDIILWTLIDFWCSFIDFRSIFDYLLLGRCLVSLLACWLVGLSQARWQGACPQGDRIIFSDALANPNIWGRRESNSPIGVEINQQNRFISVVRGDTLSTKFRTSPDKSLNSLTWFHFFVFGPSEITKNAGTGT